MDEKATILIVEDDLDIADMLNAYFRIQGYEVLTVNWGEDGIRACQTNRPDIVILDIRLPDTDGFEVARRLREDRRTKDLPIIFLTEKRERMSRLKGLELKADDYITKPFDIQELRLRVRNSLQRARRGTLTHPVTGLPEGKLVDERLTQCIKSNESALLVISIKNLDYFREIYGFVASDDLLRAVSLMLQNILTELDLKNAFLGHLTSTDFLLVTNPVFLPELKKRIRRRLEQSFDYFYRNQDRDENADLFRGQELGVEFGEIVLSITPYSDLQLLKHDLERIYR
jgi:DNA-binding response OmpR family regulator